MPRMEGNIKTNDPWTLKSKNKSTRRDMVPEQRSATNQKGTKNPGSTNKEAPHQMTGNRNRSEPGTDNPITTRVNRKANYPTQARDKNAFDEKSVRVSRGRNAGSTNKEEPKARINSGSTKVKNYPSGRNRGRNFKR